MKRRWRSRLLELLLWAAVSLATAAVLVWLAEARLPANF